MCQASCECPKCLFAIRMAKDSMLAILILNLVFMNFKEYFPFCICAARESDCLYLVCFAIRRLTDVELSEESGKFNKDKCRTLYLG